MKLFKMFLIFVICSLFFGLNNTYNGEEANTIVEDNQTVTEEIEQQQETTPEEKKEKENEEYFEQESVGTKEIVNNSKKKDNTTKKQESSNKEQEKNEKSQKKVEEAVWDKLGISEYEYYNSPQWKWQTIDFDLNGNGRNSCSSSEDCRNKCIVYGDEYVLKNEGGYRCSEVLSYSGKYLGEYFKYFELES